MFIDKKPASFILYHNLCVVCVYYSQIRWKSRNFRYPVYILKYSYGKVARDSIRKHFQERRNKWIANKEQHPFFIFVLHLNDAAIDYSTKLHTHKASMVMYINVIAYCILYVCDSAYVAD